MRLATWHIEAERQGPGVLLRDITRGDPQISAVVDIVTDMAPGILLLQGVDYDHDGLALRALRDAISKAGVAYPHLFTARPNSGQPSGYDMDGDGRLGEPEDAIGYGQFWGQGGMAILSRYPVVTTEVQDLSHVLWADMPGALFHDETEGPVIPRDAMKTLPLASNAHWIVPVDTPLGRVSLLALHAAPPVFDGPEDRNGRRNHDQIMFWIEVLNGRFGPAPSERFFVLGATNQDPLRGEGRKAAIRALLGDPRLQDPKPRRSEVKGLAPSALGDTVAWPGPEPGPLRVDYVLPSRDWTVVASGVHWPLTGDGAARAETASRHRLVWVDVTR